jgi:hypothetical protein
VVVIPTRREKSSVSSIALHQRKAEHAAVEGQRPLKVGNFQVNVPDHYAGVDRVIRLTLAHHGP